jgi:hypothetical protein
MLTKFKLIPISKIEKKSYKGLVYDFTVKNKHSYCADNKIVHNSQCTTRIVTGCGLPTLESIFRIRISLPNPNLKLIADGGIKNSGDIVKVLAAGANAVMLGHLLAGAKETPGNVIKYKGGLYKIYRGSASFGQKFDVGKDGFVEGEETLVSYKSQVTTTLTQLIEGVRSGCSYCGAVTLEELQENAEFVHITDSGYVESTAHGA